MSEVSNYVSPANLVEAAKVLASDDVTVFCGGTDLSLQENYTNTLMNIRRIEGLSGTILQDDNCRIGALTTVSEIMADGLLKEIAPVLAEAADQFASDQIRNAASIGGNICNASPAGDMIIPLLVLDAVVELASWQDGAVTTRTVPLKDFFVAPGKTVRQDNELLTAVIFTKPAGGFVAHFRKPGPRPALEISTVSVGIGGKLTNGSLHDVRVALGAVAPTPIRARSVEETLEGISLNADSIKAACASAGVDASPIDDVRASAWYRDHLVRVLTKEVLNDVLANGN